MKNEEYLKRQLVSLVEAARDLQDQADIGDEAYWKWIDQAEVEKVLNAIQDINENINNERARGDDVASDYF